MTEAAHTTLASALVAFQAEATTLQKDKLNPHFKSKYVPLDTVMESVLPILTKHGLAVTQHPSWMVHEDKVYPTLETVLVHGATGERYGSTMLMLPGKLDPQGQGAAITYARRYALMAVLGLVADEDDDGNTASGRKQKAEPKSPEQRQDEARERKAAGIASAEQRRLIFAAAREHGVDTPTLKAITFTVAGVESSNDIPADRVDAILAKIREAQQAAA